MNSDIGAPCFVLSSKLVLKLGGLAGTGQPAQSNRVLNYLPAFTLNGRGGDRYCWNCCQVGGQSGRRPDNASGLVNLLNADVQI